jgi:hypothetical protein
VPALLYVRAVGRRLAVTGGLLQATTLTFVIVATEIGLETGKLSQATAAALVAAGLLSAAVFPAAAARLLVRRGRGELAVPAPRPPVIDQERDRERDQGRDQRGDQEREQGRDQRGDQEREQGRDQQRDQERDQEAEPTVPPTATDSG